MERAITYAVDWLATRYPYDVDARNPNVEIACLQWLASRNPISVVDIGSGSGSNCFYFIDQFPVAQHWTFIEKDPMLISASLERMTQWANDREYIVEASPYGINIQTPNGQIEIEGICGSLLDLSQLVRLDKVDLVMANAVFDLFSQSQFATFISELSNYSLGILATLNYSGMSFSPTTDEDKTVIDLYESHMQRPQSFGQGMGKECSELMIEAFKAQNWEIVAEEANWEIEGGEIKMQEYLLGFMEEAIPELPLTQQQLADFYTFIKNKKQLSANFNLGIQVNHKDIFAYSPSTTE